LVAPWLAGAGVYLLALALLCLAAFVKAAQFPFQSWLLGAMVATRQNQHIRIDIIARFLPERVQRAADTLVSVFTGAICAAAAWFSLQFVASEREFGGVAFAGVPVWLCEAIIPFAFAVIALRFLILAALNLTRTIKPGP